jgi:hypothetical protein
MVANKKVNQANHASKPEVNFSNAEECILDGPETILMPEGEYEAVLIRHETAKVFNCPKVFLWFRIVQPGEHFEKEIFRAYRVKLLIGKQGKQGRFKLHPRSELAMALYRLLGAKRRPDRISLHSLKNCVWRIKVRTVKSDYKQRELPEFLYYSVVEDIIAQLTG